MPRSRLKVPVKLAVVALGAALTAGCPETPPPGPQPNLCPSEYLCSSDAARAFNCTDASDNQFTSDLGTCYPPI